MKKALFLICLLLLAGVLLSCDKKKSEPDVDSTSNIQISSYRITDDGVIIENMYTQFIPTSDPGYQYLYAPVVLDGKFYILANGYENGTAVTQIDCCDSKMNRLGSVPLGELPDGLKNLVTAGGALFVAVTRGRTADTLIYRVTETGAVEVGALYELHGWTGHTPEDAAGLCNVVSDGEVIYVCDSERLMSVYADGRPHCDLSVSDVDFGTHVYSDDPRIAVNAKGDVLLFGKDDKRYKLIAAEGKLDELPGYPIPDNIKTKESSMSTETKLPDGDRVLYGPGYDYYYLNGFGLYGMNEDETSATLLMNLVNSGVTRDTLGNIGIASPELILCTVQDRLYADARDGNTRSPAVLVMAGEGLNRRELVKLATSVDIANNLAVAISAFNAENERYRVVVTDYSQYGTSGGGADKLLIEISAGSNYDLCYTDKSKDSTYTLKRQSYYADLNQYIDADPGFSREDILQCVRDWCTYRGELVYLMPNFTVETVAVRGGTADGGWTIADLAVLNQSIEGDGRVFARIGGEALFYKLMQFTVNDFIDWDKSTCSFDSERFLGLLELCRALPKKSSVNIDDFISLLSYSQELCEVLRSGSAQALVMASGNCRLIQNPAFLMHLKYYFGDYRLVGYPSESGGVSALDTVGYIGIPKKAVCGEGAWEFIKFLLSDRYQVSELNSFNYYPATVSALDFVSERFGSYEFWFSQSTNKIQFKGKPNPDDNSSGYDVLTFTEEDSATLKAYLNGGGFRDDYNKDLYNIIREETLPFFAGKVSAEQAAKYIQSRVAIYLSEHE